MPRKQTAAAWEVALRDDFLEGLLGPPGPDPFRNKPGAFDLELWRAAAQTTFPTALTKLLNNEPVNLPPKLGKQWRAFAALPLPERRAALAAAEVYIYPALANGLHIRRECAKVESVETLETEDVNFDVVATTEAAMKPATINSQLVAALALRALSAELAADREHLWAMLEQLCSKLALDTVDSMKAQAWGLTDPTQAPPKSGRRLGPRRPTRADAQVAVAEQEHKEVVRTPQEAIKVRWARDGEEATPISDLTAEVKERRWCDIAKGTKRAFWEAAAQWPTLPAAL